MKRYRLLKELMYKGTTVLPGTVFLQKNYDVPPDHYYYQSTSCDMELQSEVVEQSSYFEEIDEEEDAIEQAARQEEADYEKKLVDEEDLLPEAGIKAAVESESNGTIWLP